MKRLISIVLLAASFILLNGVSALVISPQTQEVTIFSASLENAFVNITNNINETIYFLTLSSSNSDISFIDNNLTLTNGEIKQAKIVISTNKSYEEDSKVRVYFFKKAGIVLTPEDKNVTISPFNFFPQEIEIIKGSKVVWFNNDTIRHSVTNSLFDVSIDPQQRYEHIFNTVGEYSYWDKNSIYTGKLIVKDVIGQDYVHNPRDDVEFAIKIKSVLVETSLNVSFVDGHNYTTEAGREKEGVMIVENIGNKIASLIKISSQPNWITFSKQNFYLEAGQKTYIPFSIFPQVLFVNDTGKSYNLSILLSSNNTLTTKYFIDAYVPYKANLTINESIISLFNQSFNKEFMISLYNALCRVEPDFPTCKPKEIERIVYRSPVVPYNFSYDDVAETIKRQKDIEIKMDRYTSSMQTLVDGIKTDVLSANTNSLETSALLKNLITQEEENEKSISTLTTFAIVFLIIILVASVVFVVFKVLNKGIKNDREFRT